MKKGDIRCQVQQGSVMLYTADGHGMLCAARQKRCRGHNKYTCLRKRQQGHLMVLPLLCVSSSFKRPDRQHRQLGNTASSRLYLWRCRCTVKSQADTWHWEHVEDL
eukprot:1144729-Pelagomonas_calceolata.AAC.8